MYTQTFGEVDMATRILTATHSDVAHIDWRAIVFAGAIAGVVFLVVELLLVALTGGNALDPLRMMAAMVLGRDVLPPAAFGAGVFAAAMAVHFTLSIAFAALWAWILRSLPMATISTLQAAMIGAVFGLALYVINFYPIAGAAFPWFAEARNWISIVSHLFFGAVLGWAYLRLDVRYARH